MEKNEHGHEGKGKCPKPNLTSAKDLTIELPGGRKSPKIRLTN